MTKVILDLNKSHKKSLDLASFFVGASRVRRGQDLRVLPLQVQDGVAHLTRLKHDPQLVQWFSQYSPPLSAAIPVSTTHVPVPPHLTPVQLQQWDEDEIMEEGEIL